MGGDCHLFDKAFSSNDSIVHSRRGRGKTNENRRRHLEAPSRMGNIDYNIWETVRPPPILNSPSLSFNDHEVSLYIHVCFSSMGQ